MKIWTIPGRQGSMPLSQLSSLNHAFRTRLRPSSYGPSITLKIESSPCPRCFSGTKLSKMDTYRSYRNALDLLNSLQSNRATVGKVKSGAASNNTAISEMKEWLRRAAISDDDLKALRVIHIAGTKGKGSTAAMVSSILTQFKRMPFGSSIPYRLQNYKVGLYTSPHLVSVRERIKIDDEPLSQDLFRRYFFEIWDTICASEADRPSYFRFLTILALHVFLREGVKSAVVECGIGGEYDSTNIFPDEVVTTTAITTLGLDHMGMLGNSIRDIAWHKAGIMKKGAPCFIVKPEEHKEEIMTVIQARAAEKGSIVRPTRPIDEVPGYKEAVAQGFRLGLEGDVQKDNASLAIACALDHLNHIKMLNSPDYLSIHPWFLDGLFQVKWPGRFQTIRRGKVTYYIDGAHTVESIRLAAEWFARKLRFDDQPALIFNQETRDGAALALDLLDHLRKITGEENIFRHIIVSTNITYTPLPMPVNGESPTAKQNVIAAALPDEMRQYDAISVAPTVKIALQKAEALTRFYSSPVKVLVVGSLHLVGAFLSVIDGLPDDF